MLVIFDCDGVLVDSEYLGAEVFAERLQHNGFEYSAARCLNLFKGKLLEDCFLIIEAIEGRVLPDDFHTQIDESTRRVFAERLKAVDGVQAVLEFLKVQARSFCLASNGQLAKIRNSLRTTELEAYFPEALRFSAEHVASGKPAPDLFLYAAEQVGVPARFCWVVEDSQAGAEAAVAAGMNLIYFSAGQPVPESILALEPQLICSNMAEVLNFFKAL